MSLSLFIECFPSTFCGTNSYSYFRTDFKCPFLIMKVFANFLVRNDSPISTFISFCVTLRFCPEQWEQFVMMCSFRWLLTVFAKSTVSFLFTIVYLRCLLSIEFAEFLVRMKIDKARRERMAFYSCSTLCLYKNSPGGQLLKLWWKWRKKKGGLFLKFNLCSIFYCPLYPHHFLGALLLLGSKSHKSKIHSQTKQYFNKIGIA